MPTRWCPCCPKRLSNGICSLNEGVLRLAFSPHLMRLDKDGNLIDYRFVKSVIRSRSQAFIPRSTPCWPERQR